MGFCGGLTDGKPTHVDDFIPETGEVTADQFILWLFKAEGSGYPSDYNPRNSPFYEELRRMFVENMGSDTVDASRLKWGL